MTRTTLIYNSRAGRFPAGPLVARAQEVLVRFGWDVHNVEVDSGRELFLRASEAAVRGDEVVVVAGGDGSVGCAASALANTETALGVLPCGTSNTWARELGCPRLDWGHLSSLAEAAERLVDADVRTVDLGLCDRRPFLLWAGVGLDGQVVNRIEPRKPWQRALARPFYIALVVRHALNWKGIEVRVRALGETWKDRYVVVVASNVQSYAGGLLNLAIDARVDDGMLDFWLLSGRSFGEALLRLAQVMMHKHVNAKGVVHFQAQEAVLEATEGLPMQIDGEPSTATAPLRLAVSQAALRVLLPRGCHPPVFSKLAS